MASVHQFDSDPSLSVTTLGAALVVAGKDRGAAARTLGPGKPLALLVYLAFSPGRAATRDALVDLLWADVAQEDGRHALRQTIWYVKKNLGEHALVASRDIVRIAASAESDRDAFLAAIDSQRFEDAISLYRGDFFPDFAQPGALEFEHWADLERQRLRSAFLRAGHAVVRAWLSVARHKDAVRLARRLRDSERSEANWRLVLECLVAARDQLGATLEADALERYIATEEREPEPATRSMIRVIRQAPEAPPPTGLIAALVGRETEFAALVGAWGHARERESQHMHVTAGAGIGKTRLLADFAAQLRSQRSRVAFASARPGERSIPYSLASEVVGALAQLSGAAGIGEGAAASLVALNPSLSATFAAASDPSQGDEALRRRAIALRELITNVADERPLAILIDDWHWADEVSQRLLGGAFQRLTGERVLVVTAGRPRYSSPEGPHTRRATLAPLSGSEVGEVIASIARVPDEPWAEQLARAVHSASDGSPLLVIETIQFLIDRGVAAVESDEWKLRDLQGLHGVGKSGSAIRQRLALLDQVDREIVAMIAVAGMPLTSATLAAAMRLDAARFARHIEQLEQRGFVTRSMDSWNAAHDMIAEAALDELGVDQRREVEHRIGSTRLASAQHDAGALLHAGRHLLRAHQFDGALDAFARWVREMREDGDARSVERLAVEFAGPETAAAESHRLAAGIPFGARFTRMQKQAFAGLAAALVVLFMFALVRPTTASPVPEVELVASFERSPGDTAYVSLALRAEKLVRNDVLDLASLPTSSVHVPINHAIRALSPDRRRWATTRIFDDEGGIELVTIDVATGKEDRVTNRRGDDEQPSWSPTGDALAFSTGSFSPLARNDVAVVDLQTGSVRQLTSGDDSDMTPVWNPRGDQIAFSRRYWNERRTADLCFVATDGSSVRCHVIPELAERPLVVAWYDADRVIVEVASRVGETSGIAVIDVNTLAIQWVYRGQATATRASPDGRYVICQCTKDRRIPPRWKLLSVDDGLIAVDIVRGLVTNQPVGLFWLGPAARDIRVTRVDLVARSDTIPFGNSFQLEAVGVDANEESAPPAFVRWSSSDERIAKIDSTGLILPMKRAPFR